jgi:uncharacterized protein (TIGR03437 family)
MALPGNIILSSVLTFLAIPVTAQVSNTSLGPLACSALTSNPPPTVRSESMTERIADVVLTCTGGQAIPAGSAIPTADITISLPTNVTSRILASPNISEAMLLIDEPRPAAQVACTNYLLGAGPGGCVQYALSSSNGVPIASSSANALTPPANAFFGAVTANQVVFHGIPVLAPVTADATRVFRFTNLRVNAAALGSGGLAGTTQLLTAISVNGSGPVPINNPVQVAGFLQFGLSSAVLTADGAGPLSAAGGVLLNQVVNPFSQAPAPVALLRYSETFKDDFKARSAPGTDQNVPGAVNETESGFVFTAQGGFNGKYPGLADYGTRLKTVFRNIPPGVRVFVSVTNLAANTSSPTPSPQPSADPIVPNAVLVTGEADLYVNDRVPAMSATTSINGQMTALAELPVVNGSATAVWEVVNTNPDAIEKYNFGVWAGYNAASTSLGAGTANVSLSFAPSNAPVAESMQASATLALPRFFDTSVPRPILTLGETACQYSVSTAFINAPAASGSGTMAVKTAPQCSWYAVTSAGWVHISPFVGTGIGTLRYSVDANTSADPRSDVIWVAGQRVGIYQLGYKAPVITTDIGDPWDGAQGIAPGAWVSIYGSNLAPTAQQWQPQQNAKLPLTLGGVSVRFDGIAAPLAYVSPTLINALVPAGVSTGQVSVVAYSGSVATAPVVVTSGKYLPAIYSVRATAVPPRYYVTAIDPATSQILGNPAVDQRVTRAVRPGDVIDLYATGLGPTTPEFPTDTFFSGSYAVASPFTVVLGPATITPTFAALTAPGLYQIRINVPAGMAGGDQPIRLDFGTAQSATGVYLTVQP